MTTRILISILLSLACLPCARADSRIVVSEPGSLRSLVGDPRSSVSLVLSGVIDVRDMSFIATDMTALQSLDLSAVRITAHEGFPADNIPSAIFAGSGISSLALPAGSPVTVGDMAFMSSALKTLRVDASLRSIGMGAFAGCDDLAELVIEGSPHIGAYAFNACKSLRRVIFSDAVAVGDAAFSDCVALADVIGSDRITAIGSRGFAGCLALGGFDFGPSLTSIGDAAFSSTALAHVDLSRCERIAALSPWTFARCRSLETVLLPAGIGSLPAGLFFDDETLRRLDIPSRVAAIDDFAVSHASSLDSLSLPASLSSICRMAMCGMTSLSCLDGRLLTSVPDTGPDVWVATPCGDATLLVDPSMKQIFRQTPQWNEFNILASDSHTSGHSVATQGLKADCRVEGSRIIVSSPATLSRVTIYAPDGRMLYAVRPGSCELVYEAAGRSLLLVEAVTGQGIKSIEKVSIYGKK